MNPVDARASALLVVLAGCAPDLPGAAELDDLEAAEMLSRQVPPFPSCVRAPDPAQLGACAAGHTALVGLVGFPSLQAAVDHTQGVVSVCPGIWREWTLVDHDVSIVAVDPTPGATVLAGSMLHPMLFVSDARVVIDGVGFVNGRVEDFGGAIGAGNAHLTIRCSQFAGNAAEAMGGAIHVRYESTLVVERSHFLDNHSVEGGAISVSEYSRGPAALDVTTSLFLENVASNRGGAIETIGEQAISVRIHGSAFVRNRAGLGGAVDVAWGEASVAISQTRFRENHADGGGGAVRVALQGSRQELDLSVTGGRFIANTARFGGAVSLDTTAASTAELDGVEVWGNRAEHGAAIEVGPLVGLGWTACDLGLGRRDNHVHDIQGHGQIIDDGPGANGRL